MSKSPEIPNNVESFEVDLLISQLSYSCTAWVVPKIRALAGIIRFSGTYRPGSQGSDDAMFIKWRINEFCDLELPERISGLLVDFRDLEYTWGDDLEVQPERLRRIGAPVRVVVSEDRWSSFEGVLGSQEMTTDFKVAFDEIESAIR